MSRPAAPRGLGMVVATRAGRHPRAHSATAAATALRSQRRCCCSAAVAPAVVVITGARAFIHQQNRSPFPQSGPAEGGVALHSFGRGPPALQPIVLHLDDDDDVADGAGGEALLGIQPYRPPWLPRQTQQQIQQQTQQEEEERHLGNEKPTVGEMRSTTMATAAEGELSPSSQPPSQDAAVSPAATSATALAPPPAPSSASSSDAALDLPPAAESKPSVSSSSEGTSSSAATPNDTKPAYTFGYRPTAASAPRPVVALRSVAPTQRLTPAPPPPRPIPPAAPAAAASLTTSNNDAASAERTTPPPPPPVETTTTTAAAPAPAAPPVPGFGYWKGDAPPPHPRRNIYDRRPARTPTQREASPSRESAPAPLSPPSPPPAATAPVVPKQENEKEEEEVAPIPNFGYRPDPAPGAASIGDADPQSASHTALAPSSSPVPVLKPAAATVPLQGLTLRSLELRCRTDLARRARRPTLPFTSNESAFRLSGALFGVSDRHNDYVTHLEPRERARAASMPLLRRRERRALFRASGWLARLEAGDAQGPAPAQDEQRAEEGREGRRLPAPLYADVVGRAKVVRCLLLRLLQRPQHWRDEVEQLVRGAAAEAALPTTETATREDLAEVAWEGDYAHVTLYDPDTLALLDRVVRDYPTPESFTGPQAIWEAFVALYRQGTPLPGAAWRASGGRHGGSERRAADAFGWLPTAQQPPFGLAAARPDITPVDLQPPVFMRALERRAAEFARAAPWMQRSFENMSEAEQTALLFGSASLAALMPPPEELRRGVLLDADAWQEVLRRDRRRAEELAREREARQREAWAAMEVPRRPPTAKAAAKALARAEAAEREAMAAERFASLFPGVPESDARAEWLYWRTYAHDRFLLGAVEGDAGKTTPDLELEDMLLALVPGLGERVQQQRQRQGRRRLLPGGRVCLPGGDGVGGGGGESLQLSRLWRAFQRVDAGVLLAAHAAVQRELPRLQVQLRREMVTQAAFLLHFFSRDEVRAVTPPRQTYHTLWALHHRLRELLGGRGEDGLSPAATARRQVAMWLLPPFEALPPTTQASYACFGYAHLPSRAPSARDVLEAGRTDSADEHPRAPPPSPGELLRALVPLSPSAQRALVLQRLARDAGEEGHSPDDEDDGVAALEAGLTAEQRFAIECCFPRAGESMLPEPRPCNRAVVSQVVTIGDADKEKRKEDDEKKKKKKQQDGISIDELLPSPSLGKAETLSAGGGGGKLRKEQENWIDIDIDGAEIPEEHLPSTPPPTPEPAPSKIHPTKTHIKEDRKKKKKKSKDSGSAQSGGVAPHVVAPPTSTLSKKRRGRPPGHKNKAPAVGSTASAEDADIAAAAAAPPVDAIVKGVLSSVQAAMQQQLLAEMAALQGNMARIVSEAVARQLGSTITNPSSADPAPPAARVVKISKRKAKEMTVAQLNGGSVVYSEGTVAGLAVKTPQRRGRPPSTAAKRERGDEAEPPASAAVDAPKRRRGRPPGKVKKLKAAVMHSSKKITSSAGGWGGGGAAVVVPKRRGRPPLKRVVTEAQAEEGDEVGGGGTSTRRKPGRKPHQGAAATTRSKAADAADSEDSIDDLLLLAETLIAGEERPGRRGRSTAHPTNTPTVPPAGAKVSVLTTIPRQHGATPVLPGAKARAEVAGYARPPRDASPSIPLPPLPPPKPPTVPSPAVPVAAAMKKKKSKAVPPSPKLRGTAGDDDPKQVLQIRSPPVVRKVPSQVKAVSATVKALPPKKKSAMGGKTSKAPVKSKKNTTPDMSAARLKGGAGDFIF